jgi:hypothetical protein
VGAPGPALGPRGCGPWERRPLPRMARLVHAVRAFAFRGGGGREAGGGEEAGRRRWEAGRRKARGVVVESGRLGGSVGERKWCGWPPPPCSCAYYRGSHLSRKTTNFPVWPELPATMSGHRPDNNSAHVRSGRRSHSRPEVPWLPPVTDPMPASPPPPAPPAAPPAAAAGPAAAAAPGVAAARAASWAVVGLRPN